MSAVRPSSGWQRNLLAISRASLMAARGSWGIAQAGEIADMVEQEVGEVVGVLCSRRATIAAAKDAAGAFGVRLGH
jgi:hypothetical protein